MESRALQKEAEECRRKAVCYLGKPEAPFLLQIAREFDRLAEDDTSPARRRGDVSGQKRRLG